MSISRYHRQEILPEVGASGQARLVRSHAMVIGCGALGCVASEWLVRAGVGTVTILDRDLV
ncbi:MAG: ThiF family adenylyltransferase, partial [Planctomycetes bacterium]|nr:ThiF family adenylyltransferase [Planctomycetota bacterium]